MVERIPEALGAARLTGGGAGRGAGRGREVPEKSKEMPHHGPASVAMGGQVDDTRENRGWGRHYRCYLGAVCAHGHAFAHWAAREAAYYDAFDKGVLGRTRRVRPSPPLALPFPDPRRKELRVDGPKEPVRSHANSFAALACNQRKHAGEGSPNDNSGKNPPSPSHSNITWSTSIRHARRLLR